ncbi:putative F-box/LRR-repeat protein 22 [Bidens hawaiensis]|uniref:putative F-box/LRR-repeat protein 22 n=1 Tax=Bidens hawaiensis TaxID=980011 RepID=UPI00404B0A0E
MKDLLSSIIEDHSSENLCRLAVSRSQDQLVDVTLVNDYDGSTLLGYVSERSSQLKRLEMAYDFFGISLSAALMKFSLLKELNLYFIKISKQDIETVGRYCPMLKTLKVNDSRSLIDNDEIAIAIGQNLPELRHLELIGNGMTNIGLRVILDNCLYLETLDLRACVNIDLKGYIRKQCSKQIKCLKLPNDSLEDFPYFCRSYNVSFDDDDDYYVGSRNGIDRRDFFDDDDDYYVGSPEIFDGYISQ